MYVDDLNIIGITKKIFKTINYFKKNLEMKYLGKTRFYLDKQTKNSVNDILIHQSLQAFSR